MNRLNLLYKMDNLLEDCKVCKKKPKGAYNVTEVCESCEIYTQLREIGNQLEGKAEMAVSAEIYQDLKAKGLSDKEAAEKMGIGFSTLGYHKKKWKKQSGKAVLKAVEGEKQPEPTKNIQREKESELQALVNELSDKLSSKEETIKQLESKVAELEHLNAACSDVEEESDKLREELKGQREQTELAQEGYRKTLNKIYEVDADLENHKQWLKTAGEELNRLQKENKHLWALIGLKAAEFNG
jgi:DNA repair exonuclease SbcCD ATPase subunit